METHTNTDNWSSLLSELGVEGPPEETSAVPSVNENLAGAPLETPEYRLNEAELPIVETSAVSVEEPKKVEEEKRTFFDRFPKINIFGTPSKDPLDAVIGGKKPASAPGETFTSKKLERIEPAPGRTARRETEPAPVEKPVSKGLDPWSLVASQVGSIATEEEIVTDTDENNVTPDAVSESPEQDSWDKRQEAGSSQRGRRTPPSMFDEGPVEESKESTAVRSILNAEEPKPFADAAQRLSSILDDKPPRTDWEPERHERGRHVRGQRDSEFRRETSKPVRDPVDDEEERMVSERRFDGRQREARSFDDRNVDEPRRGQRGARYGQEEQLGTEKRGRDSRRDRVERSAPPTANDDNFNTESTWDIEEESKPVERGGRQRSRSPERSAPTERMEKLPSQRFRKERNDDFGGRGREDFAVSDDTEQLHRSIPSWNDAISAILEANAARHTKRPPDPRRGRGVRS